MVLIGERINSSRASISKAIEKRDSALIQNEALRQVEAGAQFIDVNAGTFYRDEGEALAWLVKTVQGVKEWPLCIDTANPEALLRALEEHRGKALVNSISLQEERLNTFLPIMKKHSCRAIGLCLSDSGVPERAEKRVELASSLITILEREGIAPGDILIDPMVHALSTDQKAAWVTLETIRALKESHREVLTVCGVSNVSFGLPGRRKLNQVFFALAIYAGLDGAILDPTDPDMIATLKGAQALLGRDEFCADYIHHFREHRL